MTKMVSLKKSKADRDEEKDTLASPGIASVPSEHEGVHVNLDHHHMKNLGVENGMKVGDKVDFHGRGTVKHYDTHDGRQSATLHLDKGALEHDAQRDEERDDLKNEIVKNVGKMEAEAK